MIKTKSRYKLYVTLLLCFVQAAGIGIYAQTPADSTRLEAVADSISVVNRKNLAKLQKNDSLPPLPQVAKAAWTPDPNKAVWFAVVFPGGGQIYNRKYWKLPIIYGGFAGCAYALSWNGKMLKDYTQAHKDILDGDPRTNSYYDLISTNVVIDEATDTRYKNLIKNRKNTFRRYRDMSIFAFIGVYLLSIVDAYVDAELSNFDIGPDLSLRIEPTYINDQRHQANAVGMQCSVRF